MVVRVDDPHEPARRDRLHFDLLADVVPPPIGVRDTVVGRTPEHVAEDAAVGLEVDHRPNCPSSICGERQVLGVALEEADHAHCAQHHQGKSDPQLAPRLSHAGRFSKFHASELATRGPRRAA